MANVNGNRLQYDFATDSGILTVYCLKLPIIISIWDLALSSILASLKSNNS